MQKSKVTTELSQNSNMIVLFPLSTILSLKKLKEGTHYLGFEFAHDATQGSQGNPNEQRHSRHHVFVHVRGNVTVQSRG